MKRNLPSLTISETAQALSVSNARVRELAALGHLTYSGSRINKASVVQLVRTTLIGR